MGEVRGQRREEEGEDDEDRDHTQNGGARRGAVKATLGDGRMDRNRKADSSMSAAASPGSGRVGRDKYLQDAQHNAHSYNFVEN